MLQRIDTSDVMKRATKFFDEHNNNCPTMEVTSRRKHGDIIVTRRVGIIPEAITTTFHTMLTQYVHDYNRTCSIMPAGMYTMDDLPAMHTTCGMLAKYCRCTDRTVRNHIGRLRDLKLISTKFHGSKKAFEVWISPSLLFGTSENTETGSAQNSPKIGLSPIDGKIFPNNRTHLEILEKEKGNADMLIKYGESIQGQKGRTEPGAQPLNEWVEQQGQIQTGGAARRTHLEIVAENDKNRRQKATAMLEARMPGMPKGLDVKYWERLWTFWMYAWKVLYPGRDFRKDQVEKALVAISAGVFNNFVDVMDDKQWLDYYQFQMAKLDKAGKYYDNHPEKYAADPYAVAIPGKGYFDYVNTNGFVGIDAWMKKDSIKHARNRQAYADKQEAKVRRCETLLRTARRDFEKLRQEMKPRKEVAGKNQLALFQYYNAIFKGMGMKWQDKFCNQFMEQQARDFQPPVYQRVTRQRRMAERRATIVHVEDLMGDVGEGYYTE